MSTTTCRACHSPLGPDEVFCRRCGAQVDPSSPADAQAYAPVGVPPTPAGPARDLASLSPALAGAVPAPVGRRIGAGVIDSLLGPIGFLAVYLASGLQKAIEYGVPLSPAEVLRLSQYGMVGANLAVVYLLATALWIAFWRWNAVKGLTLGRSVMGLRLVAVDTGAAPGWGRTLGRNLLLGLFGAFTCGLLGWLPVASILWDGEGRSRGWHDKWSRTVVIDARLGRDPLAAGAAAGLSVASPAFPRPDLIPLTPAGSSPSLMPAPAATTSIGLPQLDSPLAQVAVTSPLDASSVAPPPPSVAAEPTFPAAPVAPAAPVMPPPPPLSGVISAVPGVALVPPPAPPAPEPASPAPVFRAGHLTAPPASAVVVDEDEHTVMRRPRRLGAVTLAFDTGERIGLAHGQGLVGREPQPRAGEQVEHVVPIDDPDRSVSKTHLSFGIDGRGFWVLDRGSTNGTRVLHGDAELAEVGQDEPTYVAVGDVVEFGDRRFVVQRD